MIRILYGLLLFIPLVCSATLPELQTQHREPCDKTPGIADSYVLALSWQPAYCETYGYQAGKAECLHLDNRSYYSNHMSLHGLWPNQEACGINYRYCGVESLPSHCSYAPVNLSQTVATRLKQFMPSYAFGSCLERHEWNSHGSCQILSGNDYFALSIRLVEELNDSPFGHYLKNHVGKKVELAQLNRQVDKALGSHAHKKIFFGCRHGRLVDMYIHLPALIPYNESLKNLVAKAKTSRRKDSCSRRVIISDFYAVNQ